jgi:hypothetical protein
MGEINHDSRSRNRQLRLVRNHPMETLLRFFCDSSAINAKCPVQELILRCHGRPSDTQQVARPTAVAVKAHKNIIESFGCSGTPDDVHALSSILCKPRVSLSLEVSCFSNNHRRFTV